MFEKFLKKVYILEVIKKELVENMVVYKGVFG